MKINRGETMPGKGISFQGFRVSDPDDEYESPGAPRTPINGKENNEQIKETGKNKADDMKNSNH